MPPFHRRTLLAATITVITAGLMGCNLGVEDTDGETGGGNGGGNGGGGGGEEVVTQEYFGPNNWELALEDEEDFDLEESSVPVGGTRTSFAGEYELLSSGFSRLTVGANGSTGNAPAADSQLGALAVDDDLLFIRNWNNGFPNLLPFVASGVCPTSSFTANWIQLRRPNPDDSTSPASAFFGDVTFAYSDSTIESERRFALDDDFTEVEALEPIELDECQSGVITNSDMTVYFGEGGSALVHQNIGGTEESLWLALPRDSLRSNDLNATYVGYWVDYGRSGTEQVWPGTLECNDFNCEFDRITDIADTTTVADQSFTINLDEDALDSPINGFITGNSSISEGTSGTDVRPLACVANDNFNDTGDKVLLCVGQSPSNNGFTVNGFFVAAD